MFRGFIETLQFATDGTLRFVHFCGGQPICFVGLAGTAGAHLLFAPPQIFPELFGGALAAQFRLCLDRLFAALLAGFGLFIHATGLAEFAPIQKALRRNRRKVGICGLHWPPSCGNSPPFSRLSHTAPAVWSCCRSSVVEHTLGKGEVGGSIPLGSTSFSAGQIPFVSSMAAVRLTRADISPHRLQCIPPLLTA